MTDAEEPLNVLFVCSGNLCRSPMAEGLARSIAQRKGMAVEVRSCGTIAQDGHPPSENAVVACAEKDVDISEQKSRALNRELVEWADQILVMEKGHLLAVNILDWRAPFKTWTLGSFIKKKDIADPYRQSLRKYRKTRDLLARAIEEALDRIVT